MKKNLLKRIYTSIILSLVLLTCFFLLKFSWLLLQIIVSSICFFEFKNIVKKIWKRKKNSIYFVNIISFIYIFVSLTKTKLTYETNL